MAREASAIDDDCQSVDWPQQKSSDGDRYNGPRHGDWHTKATESYVDDRCETVLGHSLYTSSTRNESHTIDGALLMKLAKATAQQKRSMLNRNNQAGTTEMKREEEEETSSGIDKPKKFIVPKLEKKAVSKSKLVQRDELDQCRPDLAKRRDDLETEKGVSEQVKTCHVSISSSDKADLADRIMAPVNDPPPAVDPADPGDPATTNKKDKNASRRSPVEKQSKKQQQARQKNAEQDAKQLEGLMIPADDFDGVEPVTINMKSDTIEAVRAGNMPDLDAVDIPPAAFASTHSSPRTQKSKQSKLTTTRDHKLSTPSPVLPPTPPVSTKKSVTTNVPRSIASTRTPRGSTKSGGRVASAGGKDLHIETSLVHTSSRASQVPVGYDRPLSLRSSKEWQEQEMLGNDVTVPSLVEHSLLEKLALAELQNSNASQHVVSLHSQGSINTLGASHIAEQPLRNAINKEAQADRDQCRPQPPTRQTSDIRQTILSTRNHSSANSSSTNGCYRPSQRIHPPQKLHISSASADSHGVWNTNSLENAFQPPRSSDHASPHVLSASHAQTDSTRTSTTSTVHSMHLPRSLSRSPIPHRPDLRTVYAGRGWISPHPCSTLGSPVEAEIDMAATSDLSSHVLRYSEWLLMRDTLNDKDTNVSSSRGSRISSQDSIASSCEQLQDVDKEYSRSDSTFSVCETLSDENNSSISQEPADNVLGGSSLVYSERLWNLANGRVHLRMPWDEQ